MIRLCGPLLWFHYCYWMMTKTLNHRKRMKAGPRQEILQTAGCKARARLAGHVMIHMCICILCIANERFMKFCVVNWCSILVREQLEEQLTVDITCWPNHRDWLLFPVVPVIAQRCCSIPFGTYAFHAALLWFYVQVYWVCSITEYKQGKQSNFKIIFFAETFWSFDP